MDVQSLYLNIDDKEDIYACETPLNKRNNRTIPLTHSPNLFSCKDISKLITAAHLHSTKSELRFCADSNLAYSMLEIRDGEDVWQGSQMEIRLNTFCCPTIPQQQFITTFILKNITVIFNGHCFHQIKQIAMDKPMVTSYVKNIFTSVFQSWIEYVTRIPKYIQM